jgi:hypothetical protein
MKHTFLVKLLLTFNTLDDNIINQYIDIMCRSELIAHFLLLCYFGNYRVPIKRRKTICVLETQIILREGFSWGN